MRQSLAHWVDIAANRARLPSDADVLEAAHRLADRYLAFLRELEITDHVMDVRELPASKESIANAFCVVIATEHRPNVRLLLVKAGVTLARFQENIGDPLMVHLEAEPPVRQPASRHRVDHARIRKINRALLELGQDELQLRHAFDKAAKLAGGRLFHHA
jgi:hypothetical protein